VWIVASTIKGIIVHLVALSARTASHAAAACRRAQTVTHNNLSAMQDGISRTINLTTLVLGNKHLTLEFLE